MSGIKGRQRQRGTSVVFAVFILVMLAGLGGYAINLMRGQDAGSERDILGARAYLAAQAGMEWALWQVMQAGGSCASSSTLAAGSLPGTLAPFTVAVQCGSTSHDEAGSALSLYTLTAVACAPAAASGTPCPNTSGGEGYVEREVRLVVER